MLFRSQTDCSDEILARTHVAVPILSILLSFRRLSVGNSPGNLLSHGNLGEGFTVSHAFSYVIKNVNEEEKIQGPEVDHLTVARQMSNQFYCRVKALQPVWINSGDIV